LGALFGPFSLLAAMLAPPARKMRLCLMPAT
jgi:hypothetical protein